MLRVREVPGPIFWLNSVMLTGSFGTFLDLYQEILLGHDSFQSGPSQFIIYKHPPFRRCRPLYLLIFSGYFLFPLSELHITHSHTEHMSLMSLL
jgi:hypothetical protein